MTSALSVGAKREKILSLSKLLFKDEFGKPLNLSPTQQDIYSEITLKLHNRVGVITPTQYGKSLAVSLGVVTRASTLPESYTIIAPTYPKTRIIMSYVIQHVFDNELFLSQLKIEGGSLERLRRDRNKDHLTFRRGGEINVLTAEARNKKRMGQALLGHGCKNLIIDDSGLIDNSIYAFAKRMVGGHDDGFILETGNPVNRNHFHKAMTGSRYHHIWIDYHTALTEGRFTQEFIDEMREERFFDILYDCKFPNEGEVDAEGWRDLVTWEQIEQAVAREKQPGLYVRAGMDIGAGRCLNSIAYRDGNYLYIRHTDRERDLMKTAENAVDVINKDNLKPGLFTIEKDGLGLGVWNRVIQMDYGVAGINEGSTKDIHPDFSNQRAQDHWSLREFIIRDGKLENNPELLEQIKNCRYRVNSSGKIQIEPKENLTLRGVPSPDLLDSCTITFAGDETYVEEKHTNMQEVADEFDRSPDSPTANQDFAL